MGKDSRKFDKPYWICTAFSCRFNSVNRSNDSYARCDFRSIKVDEKGACDSYEEIIHEKDDKDDFITKYGECRKKLLSLFGIPDWIETPFLDYREYYWRFIGENEGDKIKFSKEEKDIYNPAGVDLHYNRIYRHKRLDESIFSSPECTAIFVDSYTDGEKMSIMIFDNEKRS